MLPAGATRVSARPASSASPGPGPGQVDEGPQVDVAGLQPPGDERRKGGQRHHLLRHPGTRVGQDLLRSSVELRSGSPRAR